MSRVLFSVDEVKQMISGGQTLILAGDEKALRQLPRGSWIGGTIPYFMGEHGGELSQEKIYVTRLPEYATDPRIRVYDEKSIHQVYNDAPGHGFSVIIISAMTPTHQAFSLRAPVFEKFAAHPLIGWISGVLLGDLGKVLPKVFDGRGSKTIENGAVVLSLDLPKDKAAKIGIVNIFEQGSGDSLKFMEDGFSAKEVVVNGTKELFVAYLKRRQVDIKLPLVANYFGALINTSFQAVNETEQRVDFYAPVFKGAEYKLAKPVGDYVREFTQVLSESAGRNIFFACNCILNYLYSELEGKKTGNVTGPITFGEVAYQLLNQTLAYVSIEGI